MPSMTVEEFLVTDQAAFGPAGRYELVDGRPVAHAAPAPEHGAIVVNLGTALSRRLAANPCRVEAGSAAVPRGNDRARIPDVMIRCGGKPTVLFEVISPSDEKSQAQKAERYRDLMNVDGVVEIVEVVQAEFVCRLHRWRGEINGWQMEVISGAAETLKLLSVGIEIPFSEIYAKVLDVAPGNPTRTDDFGARMIEQAGRLDQDFTLEP